MKLGLRNLRSKKSRLIRKRLKKEFGVNVPYEHRRLAEHVDRVCRNIRFKFLEMQKRTMARWFIETYAKEDLAVADFVFGWRDW